MFTPGFLVGVGWFILAVHESDKRPDQIFQQAVVLILGVLVESVEHLRWQSSKYFVLVGIVAGGSIVTNSFKILSFG
jgi:hypothetical protein